MGRNGAQKTPEPTDDKLLAAGTKYDFNRDNILNLTPTTSLPVMETFVATKLPRPRQTDTAGARK
jgi:hypothetical protein